MFPKKVKWSTHKLNIEKTPAITNFDKFFDDWLVILNVYNIAITIPFTKKITNIFAKYSGKKKIDATAKQTNINRINTGIKKRRPKNPETKFSKKTHLSKIIL